MFLWKILSKGKTKMPHFLETSVLPDNMETPVFTCAFSVPEPLRTPARHPGKSLTAQNKPGPERLQNKATRFILNSDALCILNKGWGKPIISNDSGLIRQQKHPIQTSEYVQSPDGSPKIDRWPVNRHLKQFPYGKGDGAMKKTEEKPKCSTKCNTVKVYTVIKGSLKGAQSTHGLPGWLNAKQNKTKLSGQRLI